MIDQHRWTLLAVTVTAGLGAADLAAKLVTR
jgi:hypothetical protein